MARKSNKPRKNPWDPDYAPYGHAATKGNPSEWRASYEERMYGHDEAVKILGNDNSYTVLGLPQGADRATVKAAYRRIVLAECSAAFGLTPDPVVVEKFKKIHAAYSFLMGD